jgi:hypothetical protein
MGKSISSMPVSFLFLLIDYFQCINSANLEPNFTWQSVQNIFSSLNVYDKPHSVTNIFEEIFGRTFLF